MVVYIFQCFVRVSLTKKQLWEPCCSPGRIKTQRSNVTKSISKIWPSILRSYSILLHCNLDILMCVYILIPPLSWVQFSLVAQLCPTLCDPMDCSTPGLLVHHQILEFIQTHIHWIVDPSNHLISVSPPSPPALNLSQHQGIFKWVSSSHQVATSTGVSALASVLPMNI